MSYSLAVQLVLSQDQSLFEIAFGQLKIRSHVVATPCAYQVGVSNRSWPCSNWGVDNNLIYAILV